MTRSRRKTPACGITTAVSEKDDKRYAHRAERRLNHQILATTEDGDSLKATRAVSNPWSMDKDGKQRFDPRRFPELMRK
jgi:hypothetical protein